MPRKKNKVTENLSVDPSRLSESEIIRARVEERGYGRSHEFMLHYLAGKNVTDAANEVGYARNSGYRVLRRFREKMKFRQEVEELTAYFPVWYLAQSRLKAPRLAKLDDKVLDHYEENVADCVRHPQVLKQIKQSAGLVPSDLPQNQENTINIDKMQVLLQKVLEGPTQTEKNTVTIESHTDADAYE